MASSIETFTSKPLVPLPASRWWWFLTFYACSHDDQESSARHQPGGRDGSALLSLEGVQMHVSDELDAQTGYDKLA